MRQLTPTHGQHSGPDQWKCTHCDQLFWTSNDSAHRRPPARVWAHFQQHSCETFQMISRWLAGTLKPAALDRAVNPQAEAKDVPGSSRILGRAGDLAKRVIRSMTPPQSVPARNSLFQKLGDQKLGEKSCEAGESKAKAASASHPH